MADDEGDDMVERKRRVKFAVQRKQQCTERAALNVMIVLTCCKDAETVPNRDLCRAYDGIEARISS